jgi:hypothetical protein
MVHNAYPGFCVEALQQFKPISSGVKMCQVSLILFTPSQFATVFSIKVAHIFLSERGTPYDCEPDKMAAVLIDNNGVGC